MQSELHMMLVFTLYCAIIIYFPSYNFINFHPLNLYLYIPIITNEIPG